MEVKTAHSHVNSDSRDSELGEPQVMAGKGATNDDIHDMIRMGKTQQTRRVFRSVTLFGFCLVILSIWETVLATSVFALSNGGTAGLIWGYLIVMIGFGFVVASLAEMASM
jgi:choline transport protein